MMKRLLLIWFLALPFILPAQGLTYQQVYQDAKACFDALDYDCAIAKFRFLALDIAQTSTEKEESQKWLDRSIDAQLNGLKRQLAISDSLKEVADIEKQKADSALNIANNVLEQMYFFEGQFGLTLKKVWIEEKADSLFRYGFINQFGEEVIPFEFVEATPFSRELGFAKVNIGSLVRLLDTTGRVFTLERSVESYLYGREDEILPFETYEGFEIGRFEGKDYLLKKGGGAYLIFSSNKGVRDNPETLIYKVGQDTSKFGKNASYIKIFLSNAKNSSTKLSSFPTSIESFKNLEFLLLRGNQFKETPRNIAQLKSLRVLDFSANQFTIFPKELFSLKNIREIDLSENQLYEIPFGLEALKKIEVLKLSSNKLSTLPPIILTHPSLQRLEVANNPINWLDSKLNDQALTKEICILTEGTSGDSHQLEILVNEEQLRQLVSGYPKINKNISLSRGLLSLVSDTTYSLNKKSFEIIISLIYSDSSSISVRRYLDASTRMMNYKYHLESNPNKVLELYESSFLFCKWMFDRFPNEKEVAAELSTAYNNLTDGYKGVKDSKNTFSNAQKAVTFCKSVVERFPKDEKIALQLSFAYSRLVGAYREVKDYQKALSNTQKWVAFCGSAVERFPKDEKNALQLSYAYSWLSSAYVGVEDYQHALATTQKWGAFCEASMKRFPQSLSFQIQYSRALQNQGYEGYLNLKEYPKILAIGQKRVNHCRRLVQSFPEAQEAIDELGGALGDYTWHNLYNHQYEAAEKAAKEALELTGGKGWGNASLIRAFVLQGNLSGAKTHFRKTQGTDWNISSDETLKAALSRQLNSMEQAEIFPHDDPNVAEFRKFLKKQK